MPKGQNLFTTEQRMPFLAHLGELRLRLRNALLALLLSFAGCYPFRTKIFRWLVTPLLTALSQAEKQGLSGRIVFTNLLEPFMVLMKTTLVAALFVAAPLLFFQLWRFISPGLYPRERRWAVPFVLFAACLFIVGGLFCYRFVLPASYDFFLSAGQTAAAQLQSALPEGVLKGDSMIRPMLSMDEYFGLTLTMLVVFGAIFELPLLLSILSLAGMVSAKSLWKWNRYAILIFAILGAVLTPGDLVVGQLIMTGMLTVLYNASIGIAWIFQRRRKPSLDTLENIPESPTTETDLR